MKTLLRTYKRFIRFFSYYFLLRKAKAECYEAWEPYEKAWYNDTYGRGYYDFANPPRMWAWCCHHEMEIEPMMFSPQDRIKYILSYKPRYERVTRLNNFRPVSAPPTELLLKNWELAWRCAEHLVADEQLIVLHKTDVPNHTWNKERQSIFN